MHLLRSPDIYEYLYPILLHINQGQTLSEQDMFVHILTSRDKDIVMILDNFIHKAFIKRNEHKVKKDKLYNIQCYKTRYEI